VVAFTTTLARATDPLPSWNDGPAKQFIITFVEKVTTPGSPDFIPIPERIATFDNDERVMATPTGMTTEKFEKTVKDWIATAKHPVTQRPYTDCQMLSGRGVKHEI
jgi:hypothetical protein